MAFYRPSADSVANQGAVAEFDTQVGVTDQFDALNDYNDAKYLEWTTGSTQRAACNTDVNIPAALSVTPLFINVRIARTSAGLQDPGAALYVFIVGDDGSYSQSEFSSATGVALTAIPADGVFRDYSFHPEEALHSPGSVTEEGLTVQYGPAVGQTKGFLISHLSLSTAAESAQKTVTVSSDAHSAWDQEGAIAVDVGSNLTLTLTPASTYKVADVLVDSVSVGDAAGEDSYVLHINNITTDHTVAGSAAQPVPVIAANVVVTNAHGGMGTVTVDTANAVVGQSVRFSIRPAAGQYVQVLKVDGVSIAANVDPLTAATYQTAMNAGSAIELDYTIPAVTGAALQVTFNSFVPSGLVTSYLGGGLLAGMGHESLAQRMERINREPF